MRVFLSLTRLYITSVYGFTFSRMKGAARKGPAWKRVLKGVGIGFLALYLLVVFTAMFVLMNEAQYDALAPLGLQGILLLNAVVLATMLSLVFGFLTALSTWYLSEAEDQLQALPIGPRALLGAKMVTVYLSEVLVALLVLAYAMIVFGWKERPPLPFYLHGIVAGLAVPLLPLAASYLVILALMSAGRFMRNKNVLMFVGGVVGLVFALGFNLVYQAMIVNLQDPAWVLANLGNPDAILARLGSAWPPSWLAWKAMDDPASGMSALYSLANLALGLGAATLFALAAGPAYVRSLRGFGERVLRKLAKADAFLAARLVRRPAFWTLFRREFVMMNREPMYLLNGPFAMILMPLIFGIMFVVQKDAFAEEFGFLSALKGGTAGMLVAAAAAAFLGTSTSIACTAVSRDAKMLPAIKALPVSPTEYFLAKLAHAMAFAALGAVEGAGLIAFGLGLPAWQGLLGGLVGLSVGTLVNLADLYLEMAWPRLRWDNPLAALKQNPNAVIGILGAMVLIGGLGFLSTRLTLGHLGMAAVFGGIPALLSAGGLALLPAYSRKRFAELEP